MEKKIHSDRNHVAKIKNLSGRREQRQMVWEIKEEICRSSSCTVWESMLHVRLEKFGILVPGWSELKLTQPESWQGSPAHLMTIIEEVQGTR